MTEIEDFRREKDAFFGSDPDSPLTPEQQRAFAGLRYFLEEPELRFVVEVEPFAAPESIRMQTSTGDVQVYDRFGRFQFVVGGQTAWLTIYRNEHGYFLPFADAQAGIETYGAGRYLEPLPQADGRFLIDFNLAYNPYCAYNEQWSCPITPAENRLKIPIRAGERVYEEHAG